MPAKIVQKNRKPFRKLKVDSVTLDIIESALRNARFEMDTVLFRTAMSPGIREQHDEFPLIANLEGKMVVGQFGSFIHGFLQGYDGTVEEGDVFLTNDPYSCNGAISHINDWLLLMPVFKDGRVIAWAAMFGHMTDVGGKVPGSLPTDARTFFEEGVAVPPVKIIRGGELQDDVLKLILHNCRLPTWNYSDFHAIVAALRTAAIRCVDLSRRFGDDVFYSAMDAMLERNKRAMRELIRRTVPETKQYFEDYVCDDGMGMGPYKIACTMWREGDKCIFDFAGTDPQSISSINFLLNEEMFKMFAGVYMIMVFDPQILFNDGFYDLMDVRIPEGTLLKPLKPAALSCRTHALGRIFDVLGGLLGQGNPAFMCAAGFSDSPHFMYSGYDKRRRVVPALPDRLRRHSRQAVRRRARRAFAVALVHQRAERVPRELLSAAHRHLRDDHRLGRSREIPRRQRHPHRLPVPRAGRDLDPRRPLADLSLGRERRTARRAQPQAPASARTAASSCCPRRPTA